MLLIVIVWKLKNVLHVNQDLCLLEMAPVKNKMSDVWFMEKRDVKNALKVIRLTEMVFANMVTSTVGTLLSKDTALIAIVCTF